MLRTIIIDDDNIIRLSLESWFLRFCPQMEIVGTASTAADGRKLFLATAPDVIFLDVELPDETGFHLLETIHPNLRNFIVVFITGHDHYALQAFRANALGFLVKPFNHEDLLQVTANILNKRTQRIDSVPIDEIMRSVQLNHKRYELLNLPTANGFAIVPLETIIFLKGEGVYTDIITTNNRYTAAKLLHEYEDLLINSGFLRVHKSYIVNISHIQQYVRDRETGGQLRMSNNTMIDVARRRKEEVVAKLERLGPALQLKPLTK